MDRVGEVKATVIGNKHILLWNFQESKKSNVASVFSRRCQVEFIFHLSDSEHSTSKQFWILYPRSWSFLNILYICCFEISIMHVFIRHFEFTILCEKKSIIFSSLLTTLALLKFISLWLIITLLFPVVSNQAFKAFMISWRWRPQFGTKLWDRSPPTK